MKRNCFFLIGILLTIVVSCGGKQPKEGDSVSTNETSQQQNNANDKNVEEAKERIKTWLSSDIGAKVKSLGTQMGKELGHKLAADPEVNRSAKELTSSVLKDNAIKPRLDKIESDATSGFSKKISLGWKALKAGGIDEFKQKVGADAQRVGVEVLTAHLKNDVLKDPRMAEFLKDFSPMMKAQSQMAALALQEGLSPRVTAAIINLAMNISASSGNDAVAVKVDNWLSGCEKDLSLKIERLMTDISNLNSLNTALQSFAVEVLQHERTKKEIIQLFTPLLNDSEVSNGLTAVYEAAAFEKGDDAIRDAISKVVALPIVDRELFAAMDRLSSAPGAQKIISKNLEKIGRDPKLAALIEEFILGVLETCGNMSK